MAYTNPKIIMETDVNYPGAVGIEKKITVEEWNDLLHHTHESSEPTETETVEPYDDTEVKASISTLDGKVTAILAALEAANIAVTLPTDNTTPTP